MSTAPPFRIRPLRSHGNLGWRLGKIRGEKKGMDEMYDRCVEDQDAEKDPRELLEAEIAQHRGSCGID